METRREKVRVCSILFETHLLGMIFVYSPSMCICIYFVTDENYPRIFILST